MDASVRILALCSEGRAKNDLGANITTFLAFYTNTIYHTSICAASKQVAFLAQRAKSLPKNAEQFVLFGNRKTMLIADSGNTCVPQIGVLIRIAVRDVVGRGKEVLKDISGEKNCFS